MEGETIGGNGGTLQKKDFMKVLDPPPPSISIVNPLKSEVKKFSETN